MAGSYGILFGGAVTHNEYPGIPVIQSLIGKHGSISEKELNFRIQNDCFEESSLKVFSVIRVCIVVFIGKAVIVVEIIRRIERGNVSQKEIYLLNFFISESQLREKHAKVK